VRPVLAPAARRLWRDASTLQLGLPSSRSVVLEGLDEPARTLLQLLDGTRTREQVVAEAAARGCEQPSDVLTALEGAGLLLDADLMLVPALDREDRDRLSPDLASLSLVRGNAAPQALLTRRASRVIVHGGGRVGGSLASLLCDAGVGTVDVRDCEITRVEDVGAAGLRVEDVGRRRAEALSARLRSLGSSERPTLVVLAEDEADAVAPVLQRASISHLVVRVEGHVGRVGPLVVPGRAACLRCLDLVRTALDPRWPTLAAQDRGTAVEPQDAVLAAAVAAQAALQVLQLVEGDTPASVGGTLELELPDWRWRRRSWPQHPGCECAHEMHAAAA
jgi:bacteriocin biosynthesis cyclodehydratase domain-containing protein